eukprot:7377511-Prymnesium_polylepis.2
MVFAAILARAWLKILRRYLRGQEEEELRSRMHQGKLHLEDVEFRWEAFEHMAIGGASGFRLKHGRLGQLIMTLNRNQVFGETPFYVSAQGVHLVFEPRPDSDITPEWVREHAAQWVEHDLAYGLQQKLFGSTRL